MLNFINRTNKTAGDTLVEVMISIAIIALAIAISFAISGKNLNVGLTASERNAAVGLVQGQIESMKTVQQTNPSSLVALKDKNKHFCFNPSYAVTPNPSVDLTNDTLTGYAGGCINNSKYYLDVNYVPVTTSGDPTKSSGNSFMFTARWYRVGDGPDQIVTIFYRPW